jgi:hypothetical protein
MKSPFAQALTWADAWRIEQRVSLARDSPMLFARSTDSVDGGGERCRAAPAYARPGGMLSPLLADFAVSLARLARITDSLTH